MTIQATEMARDVRVAIDMNRSSAPLLDEEDPDTLSLDQIIYSKLADAVRLVEMEAPAPLLESGHDFCPPQGDNVFMEEHGKGYVLLPGDFMRLVSFRMSDWERTVFDAITETDPAYSLQSSRFPGICGNPQKPVCAIVRRSEGLVLEFFSCSHGDAYVVQAAYIPFPIISPEGGLDVPGRLYRAAVYRAASLALASVGDQLSTTMLEISKSLLL